MIKERGWRAAGVVVICVLLAGCQNEGAARDALEKDGYTDIHLTPSKGGYDFTAKKDGSDCSGHISVKSGFGSKSSNMNVSCFKGTVTQKPATCPEIPSVCFDEGNKAEKANDFKTASAKFQAGCDKDDADCCNNLGVNYENGTGVDKDLDKALALYTKACDKGLILACRNQGIALQDKDPAGARAAYEKSCNGDDADACNNLGALLEDGKGAKPDFDQAAKLYKKACDKGSVHGCVNYAQAQVNGKGVPEDVTAGIKALDELCQAGDDKAHARGCFIAALKLNEGSKSVPADPKRALDLYERACGFGHAGSCTNLGVGVERGKGGRTRDLVKATELYSRACDLGSDVGCANAGLFYEKGNGVKKDLAKAKSYYETGCKLGNTKSCDAAKKLK
ncbi:MAG: tetratricopeptide repeat protein [Polyangiaceae bacterium]